MLKYIVAVYLVVLVGAFSVYLAHYLTTKKVRKDELAAEQLVKEEFLDHSLRNPYKKEFLNVPSGSRIMLSVEIKSGSTKKRLVFDPARGVSFGKKTNNQIVLRDANVSDNQGYIVLYGKNLRLENTGSLRAVNISSGPFGKVTLMPRQTVILGNKPIVIHTGKSKLKLRTFMYNYNQR